MQIKGEHLLAQNFILFVRQNGEGLSARKREMFFAPLSGAETKNLEDHVNAEFADYYNTHKTAWYWNRLKAGRVADRTKKRAAKRRPAFLNELHFCAIGHSCAGSAR